MRQDFLRLTRGQAIALLATCSFGLASFGAAYAYATHREGKMARDFYANEPDQTDWPTCKSRQAEWRNLCVPRPANQ